MQTEDIVNDHEHRIRRLEESSIETKVELKDIKNKQSETQLAIEQSSRRTEEKIEGFMKKVLDKQDNIINKFIDKEQELDAKALNANIEENKKKQDLGKVVFLKIWATVASVVSIAATYYFAVKK